MQGKLRNQSKNVLIAENVKCAEDFFDRLKGWIGKKNSVAVIELQEGTIERTQTAVGDILSLA